MEPKDWTETFSVAHEHIAMSTIGKRPCSSERHAQLYHNTLGLLLKLNLLLALVSCVSEQGTYWVCSAKVWKLWFDMLRTLRISRQYVTESFSTEKYWKYIPAIVTSCLLKKTVRRRPGSLWSEVQILQRSWKLVRVRVHRVYVAENSI